jgi:hypothetical protein
MSYRRVSAALGVAAVAWLVLASCGVGKTGSADWVSDVGVRLNGQVSNDENGPITYRFEYGPTEAYGSTTPTGLLSFVLADQPIEVSASVSGLSEQTTYHYRLCAYDVDGHGVCGADATVTTTSGRDSVTGLGFLVDFAPLLGIYARVDVSSGPTGESPIGVGDVAGAPARNSRMGPVTCLRVEGNRAAIGIAANRSLPTDPPGVEVPYLIFVEDRSAAGLGDLLSIQPQAAAVTTCPVPTAADLTDTSGWGPGLVHGDFVVHDHTDG